MTLVLRADVSATSVALVVVQVTAPDITAPLVFNIPVTNGLAIGSVALPAGSNRTLTMHAYDAGGIETHRGTTVLDVHAGSTPTIQITLTPLSGQVAIEVALGSVTITIEPVLDTLIVADSGVLTARVRDELGDPVAGPVVWATLAPGVAAVKSTSDSTATVTAQGAGGTQIVATFAGAGVAATVVVLPVGHYVAPNGSGAGDGSAGAPWDLQTALSGAGGRVHPGDTVWVRGGTYQGSFTTSLAGTAAAPIVVRAYPGERAIIDGNGGNSGSTFDVDGSWAVYWGLEIMNSMTDRIGAGLGLRPTGVFVRNASNVKLISLIVHDAGHGTFIAYFAHNIEIYGWIIFNGGHQNGTRSDGHGIYVKHDGPGDVVVRDNVIFNQFGHGIHAYTESDGALRNLLITGNILFNNGELSDYHNPNLLLGGLRVADNDLVADNLTYFSPGHGGLNVRMGQPFSIYPNGHAVVRNNYIVGGSEIMEVGFWAGLQVLGNSFIGTADMIRLQDPNTSGHTWSGNLHYRDPTQAEWRYLIPEYTFPQWQLATGLASGDQAIAQPPTSTKVVIRPHLYEAGRATVAIYNWGGQGSVGVDLSGVVTPGYAYEIRNVQTPFGPPVASGTYGGGVVQVPTNGVTAEAPIGGSPNAPLVTGPAFDVFVVTSRPQ
ncbi:MAG TPA: right-handed parallel beta-helix repeat-containing protein [Gemmatimonadales bacterium]